MPLIKKAIVTRDIRRVSVSEEYFKTLDTSVKHMDKQYDEFIVNSGNLLGTLEESIGNVSEEYKAFGETTKGIHERLDEEVSLLSEDINKLGEDISNRLESDTDYVEDRITSLSKEMNRLDVITHEELKCLSNDITNNTTKLRVLETTLVDYEDTMDEELNKLSSSIKGCAQSLTKDIRESSDAALEVMYTIRKEEIKRANTAATEAKKRCLVTNIIMGTALVGVSYDKLYTLGNLLLNVIKGWL
jgi:predicted  nucleic acid-binding Zn-ribbon protein